MLATEPHLAIAWDEGYTLGREARLRDWFRALADPPGFAARWRPPAEELVQQDQTPPPPADRLDSRRELLFDPGVMAWFWPFAREEPHGHPPFYALLGLAGDLIAPSWRDLPRARLGPILLFSIAAGAIFAFAAARWGGWAAALAAGSWVLQPNLFGHGHYAAYDAVLASLWVLAIIAFAQAIIPPAPETPPAGKAARWAWTALFGLILGCAAATKLTGWFLPLPFLAWAAWYRDRRAFAVLLVGMAIAAVVLFAQMPPWWTDPIDGVGRFFRPILTRGRDDPDRGPVPRHDLQYARGSAPLVQHHRLDRDGHTGGIPGHGGAGTRPCGDPALAARADRPADRGALGGPDGAAGDAAHTRA